MTLGDLSQLAGKHDLRLPAWGPYTKRYMGISHIPDVAAGGTNMNLEAYLEE